MKKYILSVILLFICLSGRTQWSFVGPAGISNGWSVQNDIAADTTGSPVITFYDNVNYIPSCLRFNGNQWVQVGNSTFSSFQIGSILGFEIDKKNNHYILFKNSATYQTSCMKYNGDSWVCVGSQYISTELTQHQSMAIDTAGLVYVAIYSQSGFKIVKENGTTWQQVTTSGLTEVANVFDLRFDNSNVAYLGYGDGYNKMNCAKLLNGNWVAVGNSDFSPWFADNPTLLITKSNQIYLGCNNPFIKCYKYDSQSNTWNIVGVEGLGGNFGGIDDLISDGNSNIYISTSNIAGDKARCFKFDGSGWVEVGSSGISESYAGSVNIVFNKADRLYVTYNDWATSKAVVKEYLLPTFLDEFSNGDPVMLYPNPAKDLFSIELNGQKFTVMIYDLRGNLVYENLNGFDKAEINTGVLGKGIYIVRVRSGNTMFRHRKLIVL